MVSDGHHQRAALNSLKMMAQSILFLLEAGASVKPASWAVLVLPLGEPESSGTEGGSAAVLGLCLFLRCLHLCTEVLMGLLLASDVSRSWFGVFGLSWFAL